MIRITEASFRYEGSKKECLKNTTLHMKRGECVLLTGTSGCGKTTITRMINGLIPSFYEGDLKGEIVIAGKSVDQYLPEELTSIVGSVFQNPRSQFFNLDSTSEIAFGCENVGMPREQLRKQVLSAAKDLNIERLLHRNIFELSNGEKQMLAIASAYAMNPDIYIMDEPSANLDAFASMQLGRIIQQLKEQGKTIVIAEHRFHFLQGIPDRILYMEAGRIKDEWSEAEFSRMGEEQRHSRGLRAYRFQSSCDGFHKDREPLKDLEPHKDLEPLKELVTVQGVSAGYGKNTVVKEVSFHAAVGEVIGIIGKNGQGKTTLAKCLCGLLKESKGSIQLDKVKLSSRKRIGRFYMVMQDPNYQLFSDCVENELDIAMKSKNRLSPERRLELLSTMSLEAYGDRHPLSLSGGEKQRLTIASAMAEKAKVILLDEPTSGLDYENMTRVKKMLEELARKGNVIFVITHDFEFITMACDRILHVEQGRLTENYKLDNNTMEKLKQFFFQ